MTLYWFGLLFVAYFVHFSAAQECNSLGLRKFDSNVAKLVTIGNSGRKFPESKGSDLKNYCDQSNELVLNLENYKNKCMQKLPKQAAGVLLYAVKNSLRQLCKKDSKRLADLINSTSCLNSANAEITKCYTKLIDSIQGAQNAVEKKRIPHVCCEYYNLYTCFHSRTQRFPACTTKKIDIIGDFMRSIFGNLVDLICGDYTENSDKCQNFESPPKKRKDQKRTKSFAVPLIEVLVSFPEV